MLDRYGREITYLRIALTDSCNLNCSYCSAATAGECLTEPAWAHKNKSNKLLSDDEIVAVVQAAANIGFRKVRLTGGEPLLRPRLPHLIRKIKMVGGIDEINITTNGTLLAGLATSLREAGLDRINISLDTLDPTTYHQITGGKIEPVIQGIDAALAAGFNGIKVNTVLSAEEAQFPERTGALEVFCQIRGIKLQRIGRYSLREPKKDYPGLERPPKCDSCDRIRITADGMLKPCLHTPEEVPLNRDDPHISLTEAVLSKPKRGGIGSLRSMQTIGG